MVVFNDPELTRRARILRDHGMSPGRRYWHECVGFNYRLTNLQAAVGVAQLERVEKLLDSRDTIAAQYEQHLLGMAGIEFSPRSPWGRHVPWLYCLLVSADETSVSRDEIMEHLRRHGIETRPLFYPLHEMPPYRHLSPPGATYPVAENLSRRGISLPSGYGLSSAEIRYICAVLKQCLAATVAVA
jgi:perosamine synthetase